MSKRLLALAACLALTFMPAAALAGKKKKNAANTNVASGPQNNGNGNGIGAGGVPALRDRIEERLAKTEADIAQLRADLIALAGQIQSLAGQVQVLSGQVADLTDRAAALEALDVDDDGDGASEHAVDDCDDADPHVFSGATEVPNNNIDENCDGTL